MKKKDKMYRLNFNIGGYMLRNIKRICVSIIFFIVLMCLDKAIFATANDYTINNYNIDIIVNEDNTYDITENITAYFNVEKHGIYRKIPLRNEIVRADGTKNRNRAKISNVYVNNEYEISNEASNLVVKIGKASTTLIGEQTYQIKYKYSIGEDKSKNFDEFYYNIIGDSWDTTISNINFTIHMPKEFDNSLLGFSIGKKGTINSNNIIYNVNGNTINGSYNKTLFPGEALTVRLTLDDGYFVNAKNTIVISDYLLYIIPIISFIISYVLWVKFGKDEKIIETVEFYPPNEYNSLDIAFLYKGNVQSTDVVSLLIYLANKGYIKIEKIAQRVNKLGIYEESNNVFNKGEHYKFIKLKEYDGNNENERIFLEGLFRKGNEVTEKDLYNKFYTTIDKIISKENSRKNRNKIFEKNTKSKSFLIMVLIIVSLLTIILIPTIEYSNIAAVIMTMFLAAFYIPFFSLLFGGKRQIVFKLVFGTIILAHSYMFFKMLPIKEALMDNTVYLFGFIIGIICVIGMAICHQAMPKRTKYGNEMYGRIQGFRQFLENVEKEKLEELVMDDPEYFYSILPYTYVLQISNKWIRKFEAIAVKEPDWYESNGKFNVRDFGDFINATMTTTTQAMTSSPYSYDDSSSSSSSGGGVSGGGSGGGGGGSW